MALAIKEVGIYEGPAYMENSEDGPIAVWDCFAAVLAADGREFRHLVPFRHRSDERLARLVSRIEATGVIDPDLWYEEVRMPLEEKWALMGQQEDEVRRGLRSEDDLYHGIP